MQHAVSKVMVYQIQADIRAKDITLFHEPGKIGLSYDCEGLVNMHCYIKTAG